jgi:hypothetical protein
MTGGMAVPAVSVACTGPVSYVGQEQIGRDLAALRAAVGDANPRHEHAFHVFESFKLPPGVVIVAAKFEAVAEGARRATARLW